MRLVRLELDRFRQIRDQRLDWRPVTVLFGPNDGGKSSVLAAVESMFASISGDALGDGDGDGDGAGAEGAVAVEFDAIGEEEADWLIWSELQNRGSAWVHSSRRPVDGDADEWFEPRTFQPGGANEWLRAVDPDPDEADVAASIVDEELAQSCSDKAVLAAAKEVFTAALESRVFRFDTRNGWQWAADPAELPATVLDALALLEPRMPQLERAAEPGGRKVKQPWTDDARMALWELKGAMHALRAGGEYTYACSWDVKRQAAVIGLWRVVRIGDPDVGRHQAEGALAAAIQSFASQLDRFSEAERADPWLDEQEGGWVRVREVISDAVDEVAQVANALAPEFITRDYEVRIAVTSPSRWRPGDIASRVIILLKLRNDDAVGLRLTEVGSALGVWTSYVVLEAVRQIRVKLESRIASVDSNASPEQLFKLHFGFEYHAAFADDRIPNTGTTYAKWLELVKAFPLISPTALHTIYLFDEPERHLHPLAQIEARDWIARLASNEECSVVLATHSLEFLDIPLAHAQYIRVARDIERRSQLSPMTDDVLRVLRDEADILGVRPTQLIHLTRCWLVVEGEHDAMIIRHFYGRAMERRRVVLFPLRGAKNAVAVGQLEHLASYRAPIHAIFDNPIASAVTTTPGTPMTTSLEKKMIEIMSRLLAAEGADFTVHELPYPDVYCVLPEEAIRATLDNEFQDGRVHPFPGWAPLLSDYNSAVAAATISKEPKPDFKRYLLKKLGLKLDPTELLDRVLAHTAAETPADPQLNRIMAEILSPPTRD